MGDDIQEIEYLIMEMDAEICRLQYRKEELLKVLPAMKAEADRLYQLERAKALIGKYKIPKVA